MSIWAMSQIPDPDYDAKQRQRADWFNRIKPAENWKLPIDCWIAATDFENCSQAAIWFTGAPLEIAERKGCTVRVTAPGYYVTIGA